MSELELLQEKLRPAVWGHGCGPIMQISQAPGRKVHESGIPFSDVSGEKLRHEWYEIEDEQFYDPDLFYITSMGHCYPGKGKSGDRRPPKCCYDMWTKREMEVKPDTRLYIIIGKEAADRIFGKEIPFERLVMEDRQIHGVVAVVLPHPSPLNRRWLKEHPDFERVRLPQVRRMIREIIDEKKAPA